MKSLMKAVAAVLALSVVGLMCGCERHDQKKEVYYLVASNLSTPYWQAAVSGFKAAGAEYKVTARVAGPDNRDPQAELAELQKAVSGKPAGILISVADEKVLQPGIDAAVSAGIPVISVDSDAAESHRLYFIGTNNLEAGRLGAKRLVERLNGKGNVVFFTFAGQPNIEDRLKGFKDVFSSSPGIKIADVVDIQADPRAAFDKAQELLAKSGAQKIDAFVSLESMSGKPVADAVERSGEKNLEVMAWDLNQDTLDAIKKGVIDASVVQKPYTMGFVGLKSLDEVFHNPPKQLARNENADSSSQYPEFVDTGTSLVTKENVDAFIASATANK